MPSNQQLEGQQHDRNALGGGSLTDGHRLHAVHNPTRGHAVPYENADSSSVRKRKREDCSADEFHQNSSRTQKPGGRSLNLMPPSLPKVKPPHVVTAASAEASARQAIRRSPSSKQSIQIYEDRCWTTTQPDQLTQPRRVGVDAAQAPIAPQFQRELPCRPPPMQSNYSKYTDSHYHNRLRSGRAFANSQQNAITDTHPAQSLAPLNSHSQYRAEGLFRAPAANHRQEGNIRLIPHERYERLNQDDSNYRTVAQQRGEQTRPPLQEISRADQNCQLPFPVRALRPQGTPAQQEISPAPAVSVTSPFFERGGQIRPPTERPPTRGSFVHPPHPTGVRDATSGYRMAQPSAAGRTGYSQQRSQNVSAFANRLYQPANHHQAYHSSQDRPFTRVQHQSPFMAPQTPRNSQGLFQRPDRPPPSATSHAPSKPQSGFHQGRVSLPPATGPSVPRTAGEDSAVSRIRGVRGVNSQREPSSLNPSAAAYSAPRNLFSSAGGRRSVRR